MFRAGIIGLAPDGENHYHLSVKSPTDLTLAELGLTRPARIVSVAGAISVRRRLMEMGVLPGTQVEVVRVAPMGDPIEIHLRGYSLSLRRDDARAIVVEPAP
jgi:Fe2+ transport system protein FeoA